MKLKLTGRQLILLGYDEPDNRHDPNTVRAIVRKTTGSPAELTPDELARLRSDALMLNTFGVSPGDARSAAALVRKLDVEEPS